MKEELVLKVASQVIKDFKEKYEFINFLSGTLKVFPPDSKEERPLLKGMWVVYAEVPDEQFGGTSYYAIYINDETVKPFMLHHGGAPGRTPFIEIINKNGKYEYGKSLTEV